jgi:hypothetical protein
MTLRRKMGGLLWKPRVDSGSTNHSALTPSGAFAQLQGMLTIPVAALGVSFALSLPSGQWMVPAAQSAGGAYDVLSHMAAGILPRAAAQDLQGAIAEAKKSRIDFIRVVSELEESVAFLERKNEAIQLIGAIPEFERIAVAHGFNNLGGDPLFRLKDDLTRTSIKWLDIRTDSIGAMKIFVRIARPTVNEQFFDEQSN